MGTVEALIIAMVIVYLIVICIIYIMLRQIGVTIDGLVWITQQLFEDLSKHVGDGKHTNGQKSFDDLLDEL